jgi:hypothetical protein
MNKYTISYTVFDPELKLMQKPEHKKYSFESEYDLLAAADEGMSTIFDEYPGLELIFRTIELTNPKDLYNLMMEQEKNRNATTV